ncbi:hypothetical protein LAJLEIBI_02052 [[Clostridium] hylemonae DSM 15053]|nr:hypothetical protein LAJLEIBI_02052 [[Clostridium] hylemonae DSM 15053]
MVVVNFYSFKEKYKIIFITAIYLYNPMFYNITLYYHMKDKH